MDTAYAAINFKKNNNLTFLALEMPSGLRGSDSAGKAELFPWRYWLMVITTDRR
jgi:hypothetical protein